LHDVSWRAHPDFRANLCFETATRSNLGGLKHWERVFLGVSLLHRYRNKRERSPYSDLFPLLSDTQIEQAEILGKAMRIGAMLWVKDNKKRAALSWNETTREWRGLRRTFGFACINVECKLSVDTSVEFCATILTRGETCASE